MAAMALAPSVGRWLRCAVAAALAAGTATSGRPAAAAGDAGSASCGAAAAYQADEDCGVESQVGNALQRQRAVEPAPAPVDGISADETEQSHDPAQMTQAWWDIHYAEMLSQRAITGDPRVPGDSAAGEVFGTDLNDREHFEAALFHSEAVLRSWVADTRSDTPPDVLVLGCGMSPLVFALADQNRSLRVRCLEISPELVVALEAAAARVPRPPGFVVADVTAISRRRRRGSKLNQTRPVQPMSVDIVIDENVLDGMGCTFPPSRGRRQQKRALEGVWWLLKPSGRLLTLSFLPPHADVMSPWRKLEDTTWMLPARLPVQEEGQLPPLFAMSWGRPPQAG